MTPSQTKIMEQCRAEAPYKVVWLSEHRVPTYVIYGGPHHIASFWASRREAQSECDQINAVYAAALYSERSKGMLTVEEVMDCIDQWKRYDTRKAISAAEVKEALESEDGVAGWVLLSDLRSRLTSAANRGGE